MVVSGLVIIVGVTLGLGLVTCGLVTIGLVTTGLVIGETVGFGLFLHDQVNCVIPP